MDPIGIPPPAGSPGTSPRQREAIGKIDHLYANRTSFSRRNHEEYKDLVLVIWNSLSPSERPSLSGRLKPIIDQLQSIKFNPSLERIAKELAEKPSLGERSLPGKRGSQKNFDVIYESLKNQKALTEEDLVFFKLEFIAFTHPLPVGATVELAEKMLEVAKKLGVKDVADQISRHLEIYRTEIENEMSKHPGPLPKDE